MLFKYFLTTMAVAGFGSAASATTLASFGDSSFLSSLSIISGSGSDKVNFSVDWTGVASGGSIREFYFTSDSALNIFLTDYTDLGSASDVSAFKVETTDGYQGSVLDDIAGTSSDCAILNPTCFAVTNTTGTGGLVSEAFQPSLADPILTLAAGDYLFTFGESGSPDSGSAAFSLVETVSEVPLPASAILLLAGLGGLGALRKLTL